MRLATIAASLVLVFAPLSVEAQQPGKVYRLGYLSSAAPPALSDLAAGSNLLSKSLAELGYVENRNLVIERRFADGKVDRLPGLARELLDARVGRADHRLTAHTSPGELSAAAA